MITFNNIVKKLGNKGGNIIFKSEIYDILDPDKKPEYQNKLDKIIYRLKSEGHLISLKSGVYVIPSEEDTSLNSVDLLEKYFYKLLKKYITKELGSDYYLGGDKALAIHLKDYSLPETVSIINSKLQKKIQIGTFQIHMKILNGRKNGKKVKLLPQFQGYIEEKVIYDLRFKIASLELALVEACIISDTYEGIDTGRITKAIKKYAGVLDYKALEDIGKLKYNIAFNRLKELSRHTSPELYQLCLKIIKQNGGCFVGEGLRNI